MSEAKFKVGDRVLVTRSGSGFYNKIAIISEVFGSRIRRRIKYKIEIGPVSTIERELWLDPVNELPEKWHIHTNELSKSIKLWFFTKQFRKSQIPTFELNKIWFFDKNMNLRINTDKSYIWPQVLEYSQELTFDQFKQIILNQQSKPMETTKKIKEYKLIKSYPGSGAVGRIEPFTTGEFSNYPDFWQPVYEEDELKIGGYKIDVVTSSMALIENYQFPRVFWDAAKVISNNSKAEVKIGCSKQFSLPEKTIDAVLNRMLELAMAK